MKRNKRLSIQVTSSSGKSAGRITQKRGSKMLYLDYYHQGLRTERSTNLMDSTIHRREAIRILRELLDDAELGPSTTPSATVQPPSSINSPNSNHQEPAISPADLTFRHYIEGPRGWKNRIVMQFGTSKRMDYLQAINDRLMPFFGNLTFFEINGVTVQSFVMGLRHRTTYRKDQPLSASRVRNIIIVLKAIYASACEEHRWQLGDPFAFQPLRKALPKRRKNLPAVFRYHDWLTLLQAMPEFYRPIAKLMVLTGMIGSELQGLRKCDIGQDTMYIRNKRTKLIEVEQLKNEYRRREVPITPAIRACLDELLARSTEDQPYVIVMADGSPYSHTRLKDNIWEPAFKRARLPYVRPYATRHTFAAWSMSIGVDINKLERLMGHSSKQMLYEVYGKYVAGLEKDVAAIRGYMTGRVQEKEKATPKRTAFPKSESHSESLAKTAFYSTLTH